MTDQEINLKISEIKGHKRIVNVYTGECGDQWEYPPDGGEPYYVGPDYINNWNHLGPLMLELGLGGWEYGVEDGEHGWGHKIMIGDMHEYDVYIEDKDFGKATALAHMEMMK